MELRNHPVMLCDGVRTWPPKWWQMYGPSNRSVAGEVGVLSAVFLSSIIPPDKVHVVITTKNGNCYLGRLIFEKSNNAKKIFDLLVANIKKPIRTIGSTDLPLNR
jgi:hypothetical protein